MPAPALPGLGEDGLHEEKTATGTMHSGALEVALLWGETVLAVESFDRPRAIPIGTLGDAALHACINTKVSRWTFPTPKDGGLVEVQYPIILKAR